MTRSPSFRPPSASSRPLAGLSAARLILIRYGALQDSPQRDTPAIFKLKQQLTESEYNRCRALDEVREVLPRQATWCGGRGCCLDHAWS